MKSSSRVLAFLGLALALAPSWAWAATTRAVTPKIVTDVNSLDEIVVTGDRNSLSGARKAIIEAEDRFFARFNELNKDNAYDVSCGVVKPTGTQIPKRICAPRIVDDISHDETFELIRSGSGVITSRDTLRAAAAVELKRRTLELLKKDPELLRALLEHARLEQHYLALRKAKFENRRIVWD